MQTQRKRTYGDSNREALCEWGPCDRGGPCRCPAGAVPLQQRRLSGHGLQMSNITLEGLSALDREIGVLRHGFMAWRLRAVISARCRRGERARHGSSR